MIEPTFVAVGIGTATAPSVPIDGGWDETVSNLALFAEVEILRVTLGAPRVLRALQTLAVPGPVAFNTFVALIEVVSVASLTFVVLRTDNAGALLDSEAIVAFIALKIIVLVAIFAVRIL